MGCASRLKINTLFQTNKKKTIVTNVSKSDDSPLFVCARGGETKIVKKYILEPIDRQYFDT